MNKAQLVDVIADRLGSKRAATEAVDVVLDTITRSVAKGDRVAITGFGSFEKQDRPARTARNPRTGEKVRVKKTAVPRFRAGQGFRDVVSGAKKLPKLPAVGSRATASAGTAPASRSTSRRTGAATRPGTPKPTSRVSGKSTTKAGGRSTAGGRTTKSSSARSAARTSTRTSTARTTSSRTTAAGRGTAKKPATRRTGRKS